MAFIDTVKYFLKHRNDFVFSGGDIDCEINQSRGGVSSFHGFRLYDERGHRKIETRHPETLKRLIKAKASLTFQIKQWAESRADGTLPLDLFSKRTAKKKYKLNDDMLSDTIDIETELNLPKWVVNAVETQKKHFY